MAKKEIRYLQCPACKQPMVDLSNDERFVNHDPDGNSRKPSTSRSDLPPPGASFDHPPSRSVVRRKEIQKGESEKIIQPDAKDVKLNFLETVNLHKKEVSKVKKKRKLRDVGEEWY